jgi:hypothetical protein
MSEKKNCAQDRHKGCPKIISYVVARSPHYLPDPDDMQIRFKFPQRWGSHSVVFCVTTVGKLVDAHVVSEEHALSICRV